MFVGEYEHQLDAKNRIRIPTKFKDELGSNYAFHKGPDGVIEIYSKQEADAMLLQFATNNTNPDYQDALLEYSSSFEYVKEDNQGRVVLSDTWKKFAGIDKDVVTSGVINHLTLMSKTKREQKRNAKDYKEHLDVLSNANKKDGV